MIAITFDLTALPKGVVQRIFELEPNDEWRNWEIWMFQLPIAIDEKKKKNRIRAVSKGWKEMYDSSPTSWTMMSIDCAVLTKNERVTETCSFLQNVIRKYCPKKCQILRLCFRSIDDAFLGVLTSLKEHCDAVHTLQINEIQDLNIVWFLSNSFSKMSNLLIERCFEAAEELLAIRNWKSFVIKPYDTNYGTFYPKISDSMFEFACTNLDRMEVFGFTTLTPGVIAFILSQISSLRSLSLICHQKEGLDENEGIEQLSMALRMMQKLEHIRLEVLPENLHLWTEFKEEFPNTTFDTLVS